MRRLRRLLRRLGWTFAVALATAAGVAASSAAMLYMQAGMRGLRSFGKWWWWSYLRVSAPHVSDHLVNSFLCGLLAFALIMIFPCLIAWRFRPGVAPAQALYGATQWATDAEAERAGLGLAKGLDGGGIVLGRHATRNALLTFPGDEHVALYAPTRTGKGISFVIPNLLRWLDSLICLDVKRENWKATAGARAQMGQRIFLFDPLSPTSETHRYNPFSLIDRESPDCFDQLQQLGTVLFPDPAHDNARFWAEAARAAWVGAAAMVAETPALPFTMESVLELFTIPNARAVINERIEQAHASGHPYSRACVRSLGDYTSSSESGRNDLYGNIRKSVSTRLAIWQNPRVCAATAESDFDLRRLRQEKMSIYVAVAPGDIERLAPLLAILFQQVVNVTCASLPEDDPTVKHHVLMMLDEFASLGPMPLFAKAFAFVAGYWLRIALVLQDPAQLDGVYGRDGAKTILDNCGVEVVFGTKSLELTEALSKRVGDNTTTAITEQRPRFWASFQWSRQSESEHPHRRPLMLPQEISRLPDTHEIIIRRGVGPIRARKIRWFADAVFSILRRLAPAVPRILVDRPMDDGSRPASDAGTATRRLNRDEEMEHDFGPMLPGGR